MCKPQHGCLNVNEAIYKAQTIHLYVVKAWDIEVWRVESNESSFYQCFQKNIDILSETFPKHSRWQQSKSMSVAGLSTTQSCPWINLVQAERTVWLEIAVTCRLPYTRAEPWRGELTQAKTGSEWTLFTPKAARCRRGHSSRQQD